MRRNRPVAKDILQPCFEQVKTVATDIFSSIKTSWDEHGNGILSGFEKFKESTRKIWDSVYGNVLKPVFDRIYDMVTWLWDKHLKPLWDNLADFFGAISEFCLNLWNNVLAPLVDFVVTRLGPPISYVIGTISDVIGTLVGIVTDVVGGIIKSFTGRWISGTAYLRETGKRPGTESRSIFPGFGIPYGAS